MHNIGGTAKIAAIFLYRHIIAVAWSWSKGLPCLIILGSILKKPIKIRGTCNTSAGLVFDDTVAANKCGNSIVKYQPRRSITEYRVF